MAATKFLALVAQTIIQHPQMVGDELDEATHERMQQRAEHLSQEMTRLLQELEQRSQEQMLQQLEQRSQEQSGLAWGALLFAALQQWQLWAIAGVLVLLCGLCWWLRKRSHEPDSSSEEESSSSDRELEEEEEQEEEGEQEEEESEGEDPENERDLGRIFAKRIQWPAQNLAYRSRVVEEVVGDLLRVFHEVLSNDVFPVLQTAIRVGLSLIHI